MHKITLNSGRDIALFRLYQRYTYEGVLAGVHTDERNNGLCDEVVAHARARPWVSAGAPVTLIRPKIRRERAHLTPAFLRQWERLNGSTVMPPPLYVPHLPHVICIGCFASDVIKAGSTEIGSRLCIVWFQDDLALPVDPSIATEIRRLEWDSLAVGYDF